MMNFFHAARFIPLNYCVCFLAEFSMKHIIVSYLVQWQMYQCQDTFSNKKITFLSLTFFHDVIVIIDTPYNYAAGHYVPCKMHSGLISAGLYTIERYLGEVHSHATSRGIVSAETKINAMKSFEKSGREYAKEKEREKERDATIYK